MTTLLLLLTSGVFLIFSWLLSMLNSSPASSSRGPRWQQTAQWDDHSPSSAERWWIGRVHPCKSQNPHQGCLRHPLLLHEVPLGDLGPPVLDDESLGTRIEVFLYRRNCEKVLVQLTKLLSLNSDFVMV